MNISLSNFSQVFSDQPTHPHWQNEPTQDLKTVADELVGKGRCCGVCRGKSWEPRERAREVVDDDDDDDDDDDMGVGIQKH